LAALFLTLTNLATQKSKKLAVLAKNKIKKTLIKKAKKDED
jgi:hypothetical protein